MPTVNRAPRNTLKAAVRATAVAAMIGFFAAGAAHAQSSVSLYGQVDEWVGATKFPGGQRAWNVSGGGMSTSYWGMKGAEDLGNGYKAIFTPRASSVRRTVATAASTATRSSPVTRMSAFKVRSVRSPLAA